MENLYETVKKKKLLLAEEAKEAIEKHELNRHDYVEHGISYPVASQLNWWFKSKPTRPTIEHCWFILELAKLKKTKKGKTGGRNGEKASS